MSEIRPQSSNHRNPANAPSAAEAPKRTRTSEESGMQKDQHTSQSPTALLCEEARVNTLETNSLCCEAAGIIAPSSSTTEALIPHEKLREAATPNATLIAQNCPPAQPVVGYPAPSAEHERNTLQIKLNTIVVHLNELAWVLAEGVAAFKGDHKGDNWFNEAESALDKTHQLLQSNDLDVLRSHIEASESQSQAVIVKIQIDERSEFEKEFSVPEGLQYCAQRSTYIATPDAKTSDSFAREHYAYRAAFAAWKRRAWKHAALVSQQAKGVRP